MLDAHQVAFTDADGKVHLVDRNLLQSQWADHAWLKLFLASKAPDYEPIHPVRTVPGNQRINQRINQLARLLSQASLTQAPLQAYLQAPTRTNRGLAPIQGPSNSVSPFRRAAQSTPLSHSTAATSSSRPPRSSPDRSNGAEPRQGQFGSLTNPLFTTRRDLANSIFGRSARAQQALRQSGPQ